ncbi:MAG: protein phosphatase CheZ [Zoogloea sp.]|uniref:protein phosphatase CheZ n=1 Tax=Zoogloea sp. TaxID=49181 RepID=UPI003F394CB3
MSSPASFGESGDTADLQALFDSIAAPSVSATPPTPEKDASGDSSELQDLFDSISAEISGGESIEGGISPELAQEDAVFNRLGHMARQLHDSLRGLGYDRMIEDTAQKIPDARQRLQYIAQMTEQAASRVLNATDIISPIQSDLLSASESLAGKWERMFANQLSVEEFRGLAAETRAYFQQGPAKIKAVNAQVTEIMMAQDFQDLTGQVIKKVVEMAQELEAQLLSVLIESIPENRKEKVDTNGSLLNGPVINGAGRNDVVTTQTQVDELLESLGF